MCGAQVAALALAHGLRPIVVMRPFQYRIQTWRGSLERGRFDPDGEGHSRFRIGGADATAKERRPEGEKRSSSSLPPLFVAGGEAI